VGTDLAVDEISSSLRQHISAHLPHAQITPASDLLNEIRLIKSHNEVEKLRAAAGLADLVAEAFRKTIRPGMQDHKAVVIATQAARIEGAEDCSIILSTHPSRMALPPCGFEFQQGHTVACEISVQLDGYWVQICRVLSMGKPTAAQKDIFEACWDAQAAAVRAAKPGVPVASLLECAHKVIAEAGYMDYIQYGPGHGVGLDLPELYPLDLHCTSPLAAGVVMIIHPAIWVPDRGAAFVGGPMAVSGGEPLRLDNSQREILET
jgi:Xaa-Pro aminopeptidase